jgi:acetyl esterase/lipase
LRALVVDDRVDAILVDSEFEGEVDVVAADDLSGLPPTYIEVGTLDILRDEDIAYACRLLRAGVSTEVDREPLGRAPWDPTTTAFFRAGCGSRA